MVEMPAPIVAPSRSTSTLARRPPVSRSPRPTHGDIPPKLIGASITVIGSKAYLFGGCFLNGEGVASHLYICDLDTFKWQKVEYSPEDSVPLPRCFHSADGWDNQLVIFGGFGAYDGPLSAGEPGLLNDVQIFDTTARRWLSSHTLNGGFADIVDAPKQRHSHLSAISSDRLFIIGGEDVNSNWLDDLYVYDLREKAWIQQWHYPRTCASYLNVAACAEQTVRIPSEGNRPRPYGSKSPSLLLSPIRSSGSSSPTSPTPSPLSLSSTYLESRSPLVDYPSPNSPSHLPYSARPTEEFPCDIYVYSNHNSTQVKRRLEAFSPPLSSDFTVRDQSPNLSANPSPPLLRSPSAAVVGTHFIVAGTYIGANSQFFSIWALDLLTMTWSHVDTGSEVAYGSWFQGRLWRSANRWIMFGDRHGSIANDHSQRLSSWTHVALIDLELFGLYQPPPLELELSTQDLCLTALEEAVEGDFEFVCDEGQRVRCSRKMIEGRWPWFTRQMTLLLEKAKLAMGILPASSTPCNGVNASAEGETALSLADSASVDKKPDSRITTRAFKMGESYAVTLSLLQYFYTMSLLTSLQQTPVVLSSLMMIASRYDIPHLLTLVKHAMHLTLSDANCDDFYEAATRCGCHSLKVRAFRYVLSYRQRGAAAATPNLRPPPQPLPEHAPSRPAPVTEPAPQYPTVDPALPGIQRTISNQPLFDVRLAPQRHVSPGPEYDIIQPLRPSPPSGSGDHTDPYPPSFSPSFPLPSHAGKDKTESGDGKKSKKSLSLLKILRSTSRGPTRQGGSTSPSSAEPPRRKAGGGGGRHPTISSQASKEQKIRAIEAAANGLPLTPPPPPATPSLPEQPSREAGSSAAGTSAAARRSEEEVHHQTRASPAHSGSSGPTHSGGSGVGPTSHLPGPTPRSFGLPPRTPDSANYRMVESVQDPSSHAFMGHEPSLPPHGMSLAEHIRPPSRHRHPLPTHSDTNPPHSPPSYFSSPDPFLYVASPPPNDSQSIYQTFPNSHPGYL